MAVHSNDVIARDSEGFLPKKSARAVVQSKLFFSSISKLIVRRQQRIRSNSSYTKRHLRATDGGLWTSIVLPEQIYHCGCRELSMADFTLRIELLSCFSNFFVFFDAIILTNSSVITNPKATK